MSDIAEAKSIDLATIPMVDFAGFADGTAATRARVAQTIRDASETIGFFYLKNHGVSQAQRAAVFDAAKSFFALPQTTLMTIEATSEHYRGYMPLASRTDKKTGLAMLVEAFKMQIELPPDDPDLLAGKPLHQTNKWPADMPEWRDTVLGYWDAMIRLSDDLLAAFALAVDLPETYFHKFYVKPLSQLSLLHYPPQPPHSPSGQWGIEPHTDTGAFTILAQDDTGGLQVQHKSEGWIEAPPVADAYIVNIGDMMARWTNGRFASTPHRVVNRTGKDRISVPFFMNPDYDAVIECVTAGEKPRFPPLHVGEFMYGKFTENWKKP